MFGAGERIENSPPRPAPRHVGTSEHLQPSTGASEPHNQIKARPVAATVGGGSPATRPCTPVRNGDRAQGKEKSKSLNSLNSHGRPGWAMRGGLPCIS